MLKNAGLGVAMGNSAPYIQKMAKEVTLDNNSGGVAHIVEKYILNYKSFLFLVVYLVLSNMSLFFVLFVCYQLLLLDENLNFLIYLLMNK